MKGRRPALVVGGLALILAAAWAGGAFKPKPRERAGRPVEAVRGTIEDTVEATGSVVPLHRVEVKPPIGGRIDRLLVSEGDAVKAGQIIAWMSSHDRAAILDAARAQGPEELQRWEDAYKPTPIVSPLSGLIILRNVVPGQTVESNTVLFALADTLIVLAQVDESEIGRIKSGMEARIVLDSYPDRPVDGRVFDILYEGKNVSNVITYGVKVRPGKVPPFFRSQMTANVAFVLGRKEDAVLLPAAAVQEAGGRKRVLLPGPDGKPVAREIKTGLETGERVEVLEGVEAGERVLITRGRYVPQQGPQGSPLAGGNPQAGQPQRGEAPRPQRRQR